MAGRPPSGHFLNSRQGLTRCTRVRSVNPFMKQSSSTLLPPASGESPRPEGVLKPVPVRFEFRDPTALSVAVAGTFNDWDPKKHTLQHNGDGVWFREAKLHPGQHEYCMVVDGHWMPDPVAQESRPNPFGGRNSVLMVSASRNGSSSARK